MSEQQYEFEIGQVFTTTYPPQAAVWCNKHGDRYITEIEKDEQGNRRFQIVKVPDPTPEELAEQKLQQAKQERAKAVESIIVEVDGLKFNGDETSQDRMSRALKVAEVTGMQTTVWVMADDSVVEVTKSQMEQALAKAMLQQGELWTVPYEEETPEQV